MPGTVVTNHQNGAAVSRSGQPKEQSRVLPCPELEPYGLSQIIATPDLSGVTCRIILNDLKSKISGASPELMNFGTLLAAGLGNQHVTSGLGFACWAMGRISQLVHARRIDMNYPGPELSLLKIGGLAPGRKGASSAMGTKAHSCHLPVETLNLLLTETPYIFKVMGLGSDADRTWEFLSRIVREGEMPNSVIESMRRIAGEALSKKADLDEASRSLKPNAETIETGSEPPVLSAAALPPVPKGITARVNVVKSANATPTPDSLVAITLTREPVPNSKSIGSVNGTNGQHDLGNETLPKVPVQSETRAEAVEGLLADLRLVLPEKPENLALWVTSVREKTAKINELRQQRGRNSIPESERKMPGLASVLRTLKELDNIANLLKNFQAKAGKDASAFADLAFQLELVGGGVFGETLRTNRWDPTQIEDRQRALLLLNICDLVRTLFSPAPKLR